MWCVAKAVHVGHQYHSFKATLFEKLGQQTTSYLQAQSDEVRGKQPRLGRIKAKLAELQQAVNRMARALRPFVLYSWTARARCWAGARCPYPLVTHEERACFRWQSPTVPPRSRFSII